MKPSTPVLPRTANGPRNVSSTPQDNGTAPPVQHPPQWSFSTNVDRTSFGPIKNLHSSIIGVPTADSVECGQPAAPTSNAAIAPSLSFVPAPPTCVSTDLNSSCFTVGRHPIYLILPPPSSGVQTSKAMALQQQRTTPTFAPQQSTPAIRFDLRVALAGVEENQSGHEKKEPLFSSSIFFTAGRTGAAGGLAGAGRNETVVAPTGRVSPTFTRGGAATPVVVVGRHEKIQQKQKRSVFSGLSIEMKKNIVDAKISNFGRHAATDEVEATGAMATRQRVKKKAKGGTVQNHGGPGHLGEGGQNSSAAEAVPMTLAACLTTGNDLSVRDRGGGALSVSDRGGELTRATAASSVFGSTTSDATNDQVDPPMNEEGKAEI